MLLIQVSLLYVFHLFWSPSFNQFKVILSNFLIMVYNCQLDYHSNNNNNNNNSEITLLLFGSASQWVLHTSDLYVTFVYQHTVLTHW